MRERSAHSPERLLPAPDDDTARFTVMPGDVADELRCFWNKGDVPGKVERDGKSFGYLLSTRRMRDFFNSNGRHGAAVRERSPTNPAYLNPRDLAKLGIAPGDEVDMISPHGRIGAVAAGDEDVRRGVVSLAHGWGGVPG